jgi:hypothetical protein
MPRYLVEIPHEDEHAACVKALHALQSWGSHWVTHAEFGCYDGVHCGWLTVELDNRADAQRLIPPEFRSDARIVKLNRFTPEELATLLAALEG